VFSAFLRGFPASLVTVVSELLLRLRPATKKGKIAIIDPIPDPNRDFVGLVLKALEMIASNDPRRSRRLNEEVRTIINIPVPGGAEYSRFLRTSRISFEYFSRIEDGGIKATLVACRLISHATYGYLCTRRIPTNNRYERVMRLCYKEEARFAKTVGFELGDAWGHFGREPVPISNAQRREWAIEEAKHAFAPGDGTAKH
jgi:hypothetical protein